MPFKSEKQRRWMHKNKPGMAKDWEKKQRATASALRKSSASNQGGDSIGGSV
jgi:hypothetical protein